MNVIDFLSQPWHWTVSGFMIALVMFLLLYLGQKFGISSAFETACTISGAGRLIDYFKVDWKHRDWLVIFVIGTIIGGWIGVSFLGSPDPVMISDATVADLKELGIAVPQTLAEGRGFLPKEIISFEGLATLPGLLFVILGGFLIGFGTRWAGGCTSGHAISGLSNLELPSLIAVMGFFIGGLFTTFVLFPLIF
jgi:uncharacterized membrane protein YedE/YeeE